MTYVWVCFFFAPQIEALKIAEQEREKEEIEKQERLEKLKQSVTDSLNIEYNPNNFMQNTAIQEFSQIVKSQRRNTHNMCLCFSHIVYVKAVLCQIVTM